jgi:hypothetical protein
LGIVASEETGKVFAPSFRRAMSCGAVRLLLALTMSAAMPDTIGAEKLVPRLGLSWSVYPLMVGVVVPALLVVSMG